VFWSRLAGSVLVRGWQQSPSHALILLLGFYLAMVGARNLLVLLSGAARGLGTWVNRELVGLSALALSGFGPYQLLQGLM